MLRDDDKITPFELAALMIVTILEMGIITFPRTMTERVHTDSWLVPLPAFLFTLLALFFMVRLGRLFPGQTFVEYSQEITGPIIGRLLVVVAVLFWLGTSARVLRQFADVIKVNLLFRTPIEVIIFSMLLSAAYLARHGVEPMARVAIIVSFMIIPIGLLLLNLALLQARVDNLLPVFVHGPLPILKEGFLSIGAIEGMELPLLLLPFLTRPRQGLAAGAWALAICWFIVFQVVIISLAVFGATEVTHILRPGLSIIQTIELPTLFIERLSSVYVATWVALIFPSLSMFMFLVTTSLSRLFQIKEQKILVYPLLPIIYTLAIIPSNVVEVGEMTRFLEEVMGVFVIGVMPALLFLVAKVRKKGGF